MIRQFVKRRNETRGRHRSRLENIISDTLVFGNRIPKDFFITSGLGESDIAIHAGSYHLALKDAGIEGYNHITYSSILPKIANEIKKPEKYVHGSVMETITAVANAEIGQRATAALAYGWLYDKATHEKFGGVVCEYNGHDAENVAEKSLKRSLNELYISGYAEDYLLNDIKFISRSFLPRKRFGTALVAICFTSYIYPYFSFPER